VGRVFQRSRSLHGRRPCHPKVGARPCFGGPFTGTDWPAPDSPQTRESPAAFRESWRAIEKRNVWCVARSASQKGHDGADETSE
jgi:hypothetical protein